MPFAWERSAADLSLVLRQRWRETQKTVRFTNSFSDQYLFDSNTPDRLPECSRANAFWHLVAQKVTKCPAVKRIPMLSNGLCDKNASVSRVCLRKEEKHRPKERGRTVRKKIEKFDSHVDRANEQLRMIRTINQSNNFFFFRLKLFKRNRRTISRVI